MVKEIMTTIQDESSRKPETHRRRSPRKVMKQEKRKERDQQEEREKKKSKGEDSVPEKPMMKAKMGLRDYAKMQVSNHHSTDAFFSSSYKDKRESKEG